MPEEKTLKNLYEQLITFSQDNLLVWENWLQCGVIIGAILIGWFLRRQLTPVLKERIDRLKIHYRLHNSLENLSKLTLHASAAFLLLIAVQLKEAQLIPFNMQLASATISLLMAWIFIRIVAQFIENSFFRHLVATVAWIIAALSIMGVLEDTANTLDSVGLSLGEFRLSALGVVKGAIALFILLYIATFVSSLVEKQIYKVSALTASSRVLISKIIRVILITFALLIGITTAGVDLSLLAVLSGAIGLGIGFGLQKGVSNLFSGMLLLLDKSIKPGDIIELQGGTFGWVDQMGARYTSIVTRDNKSFLIPNEDFITQQVINWSHGNTLVRIEVQFGVHYEHNPHEIKEIAEKAAAIPERICSDPKPVCHLVEFGESSLNFKLRFWIKDAEKGVTNMRGAVMLSLWDAFNEHNIRIPYPHREVLITQK